MLVWWLTAALAQAEPAIPVEPAPAIPVAADPVAEPAPDEIVIWGAVLAERARQEIVDKARAIGYTRKVEKDDRTILRHELPWKGDLVLYHDGRVELKRQPVRFEPVLFEKKTPATWLTCLVPLLCLRTAGQTVSLRRFRSYERDALGTVADDVVTWNDRLADAAVSVKVEGLPERLEALWFRGLPLGDEAGVATLETWEARRAALLAFWDSRTETSWGEEVREAVESFVLGEVQAGEHPFTAEEIAAFDARRTSSRPFPFRRSPSP